VSDSPSRLPARVAGGLSLAGVLAGGYLLSGKVERDSRARLAVVRGAATVVTPARVGSMAEELAADPARFAENAAADASAWEIAELSVTQLAQAQIHDVAISEPITLAPGRTWSGSGLEIEASIEKVKYQDHGATVTARHSVLTATNVSERPLAYYLRATAAGTCAVRGARMHDAMVLRPKQSAEIVVCAGTSRPQILRLETLSVSELGARYLDQVPPSAVGHDAITDRAHRPEPSAPRCDVDTRGIAGAIRDGKTRWVDVVDFYSRHNCHRFAFFVGYAHTGEPVPKLPVLAP
jgi:hypothetical protein